MSNRIIVIFILLIFLGFQVPSYSKPLVLITYHSKTGNTLQLAEAIARGAAETGVVRVMVKPVSETTHSDLLAADAIIVGSPVYNANVSPEVQAFISSWPFEGAPLRNKIGAAFVTAGGISAGEELVQMSILQSMLIFGMIVVGGEDWKSPFGASAIVSEMPFQSHGTVADQFLEKGRGLGRRVAHLANSMYRQKN